MSQEPIQYLQKDPIAQPSPWLIWREGAKTQEFKSYALTERSHYSLAFFHLRVHSPCIVRLFLFLIFRLLTKPNSTLNCHLAELISPTTEFELNFEKASPTVRVHRHVQAPKSIPRPRSHTPRGEKASYSYPPVFSRFRKTSPSLASSPSNQPEMPPPPSRDSSKNSVTLQKWSRLHKYVSPSGRGSPVSPVDGRSRSISPEKPKPPRKESGSVGARAEAPKKSRSMSTEGRIPRLVSTRKPSTTTKDPKPDVPSGNGNKLRKKRLKEDESSTTRKVVETIDYRCDNSRFWLSAHNCQVPTPTSQNLELEQQIRIFGAD